MKILALETATPRQSIALFEDSNLLGFDEGHWGRSLTRHLLPAIKKLLEAHSLQVSAIEGLAISIGPGSFTGLRVGLSTFTAFRLAFGIPLVGISTLEGLAWNVPAVKLPLLSMVSIRPGLVYWARYRWEGAQLLTLQAEQVGEVATVCDAMTEPTMVLGDGWVDNQMRMERDRTNVVEAPSDTLWPSAIAIGRAGYGRLLMGEHLPEGCTPNYIQPSYAERQKSS